MPVNTNTLGNLSKPKKNKGEQKAEEQTSLNDYNIRNCTVTDFYRGTTADRTVQVMSPSTDLRPDDMTYTRRTKVTGPEIDE